MINHSKSSAETADPSWASWLYFIRNPFGKLERLNSLLDLLRPLFRFDLNAFGACKVLVSDSCRWKFLVQLLIFLLTDIVGNNSLLSEKRPVEIVLPRNMWVLCWESNWLFACNLMVYEVGHWLNLLLLVTDDVHIPHSHNKLFKVTLSFNLGVEISVVVNEIRFRDSTLVFEIIVCAV